MKKMMQLVIVATLMLTLSLNAFAFDAANDPLIEDIDGAGANVIIEDGVDDEAVIEDKVPAGGIPYSFVDSIRERGQNEGAMRSLGSIYVGDITKFSKLSYEELWNLYEEVNAKALSMQDPEIAALFDKTEYDAILNQKAELVAALEKQGCIFLTDQEANQLINYLSGNASVNANQPPSTSSFQWSVYKNDFSWTRSGKTYTLAEFRGVPKNINSNMNEIVVVDMFKTTPIQNMVGKYARFLVSAAANNIFDQFAKWVPYDLFFPSGTAYTMNSDYQVHVNAATTVQVTMVYVPKDLSYYQGLLTHRASMSETHLLSYIVNGVAKTSTISKSTVAESQYYTPTSRYDIAVDRVNQTISFPLYYWAQTRYEYNGTTKITYVPPYCTNMYNAY